MHCVYMQKISYYSHREASSGLDDLLPYRADALLQHLSLAGEVLDVGDPQGVDLQILRRGDDGLDRVRQRLLQVVFAHEPHVRLDGFGGDAVAPEKQVLVLG